MKGCDALGAILCGAALLAFLSSGSAARAAETDEEPAARRAVVDMVDAVLGVLRDASLTTAQKRRQVEDITESRFDFQTISKLVVARNWRRLSKQQRLDFVEEFKRHLSITYSANLENYGNETVAVQTTRAERNGDVTVRTQVEGSDLAPVRVDYRLREREGSWLVIDVIIDGVSLLSNFRAQIQEIVGKDGPDGLIERLREKNAERDDKA